MGNRIGLPCPDCDGERTATCVALIPLIDPDDPTKVLQPHEYTVCDPCFEVQKEKVAASTG
jgi:hypothetical protein